MLLKLPFEETSENKKAARCLEKAGIALEEKKLAKGTNHENRID